MEEPFGKVVNMPTRKLDSVDLKKDEDWVGNNAAFTCPNCGKVFIVSALIHRDGRQCPTCSKSIGHVKGGRNAGGIASIECNELGNHSAQQGRRQHDV